MNMKRTFFFAIIFLATLAFAQTQSQLFNGTWKKEEIENLQKGEIVIRNIRKAKKISLNHGANPHADKVIKTIDDLDPVYLAEIIYKMPKAGNENIVQQAVTIFSDISLYKEIIYTDERKGKACPLFPEAEVKERQDTPAKIRIATHLQMDMLSDYDSELIIKNDANGFFFEQRNKTPLKWKSFTAVKSENMRAAICCFEFGGEYYVYALGGIKAPRIPFVLKEIERQFIGRIKDFTVFYIKKFNIKR